MSCLSNYNLHFWQIQVHQYKWSNVLVGLRNVYKKIMVLLFSKHVIYKMFWIPLILFFLVQRNQSSVPKLKWTRVCPGLETCVNVWSLKEHHSTILAVNWLQGWQLETPVCSRSSAPALFPLQLCYMFYGILFSSARGELKGIHASCYPSVCHCLGYASSATWVHAAEST